MTNEPFVLTQGNRFISVDPAKDERSISCAVMGRWEDGRLVIERVKWDEPTTATEERK